MNLLIDEALQRVTDLRNTHVLKKHQLPALKYDYAALEPYINYRTMVLHYDNHHAAYVRQLNEALIPFPDLQSFSALWLLCHLDQIPSSIKLAIHQNAGGHVNHSMFWRSIKPFGLSEPKGLLRDAINRDFGSLADFKKQFEYEGAKLSGSGWVWLVKGLESGSRLRIITTSEHNHPLMQNLVPILLNDVWEHAYYLQYERRRSDYLKAWWPIVDWEQASSNYEHSSKSVSAILKSENRKFLGLA